jgi:hypothetical protein
MKLTQSWIGWVDRSYEQIKASVLRRLSINNPEISDHSESNILIIILSFFAGIAEGLHLYIDNMAREAYIGVARKFRSIVRLVRLIDYNIKARWYASVDLVFTLTDSQGNVKTYNGGNILIPKGTLVRSDNGVVVRTILDTYLIARSSSVVVTAVQYSEVVNEEIGTTNGSPNQAIALPDNYVHNSLTLKIEGEFWTRYNYPALMGPNTKGFITYIDENGDAFFQFGDGLNGVIPNGWSTVLASYKTSEGKSGNLPPNSYINLTTPISMPDNTLQFRISHSGYASAGTDFETIDDIRRNGPRSLRTLERAVTYQDYIDVTNLQPGVGASEVRYKCGKYVDIFIVPKSKGIATAALTATTQDALNCAKMITTQVKVLPSGLSRVYIKAKVYARPLYDTTETLIDVLNALDAEHGYEGGKINGSVVISDIQTTMELVQSVDRVEIESVKIEPYIRNTDINTSLLNITFNSLPAANENVTLNYKVVYIAGNFQIYKGQYLVATIAVGQSYIDNSVNFTLKSGSYTNGQTWEFNVFPGWPKIFPNTLIRITDYSMPIVDVGPVVDPEIPRTIFGDIQVVGQTISTSCLPPATN